MFDPDFLCLSRFRRKDRDLGRGFEDVREEEKGGPGRRKRLKSKKLKGI